MTTNTTTHRSGRQTEIATTTTIEATEHRGYEVTSVIRCERQFDGEYDSTIYHAVTSTGQYLLINQTTYSALVA
jgi:hypothetical protein